MTKYISALLMVFVAWPSVAADPNGYTAQYECRAGGPNCNVDVATLGRRACDQIVSTSTPWSSIKWSSNTICIEAGDHTSKGALTISFSGTSSNYKVLRYYRANDTDDEPWHQSSANQAKITRIKFLDARYWIVHRLVFDPNYATDSNAIWLSDNVTRSDHIIINRVLAQHGKTQVYVEGANDSVIQNSVLRDSIKSPRVDSNGIALGNLPQNIWAVNNEIYRIYSHGFYINPNSESPGTVIENNDIYVDSSQWTDCLGNYTPNNPDSPCSASEAAASFKSGGTAAAPVRFTHNRTWGHRHTDLNVCCAGGGGGQIISLSDGYPVLNAFSSYVLIQNNIITDGQQGIQTPREGPHHHSIIGNIIYRINNYYAAFGTSGSAALSSLGHWDNTEVYLNTIIDSGSWADIGGGNENLDVKCNAVLGSGQNTGGIPGAGSVVNYNAFIGTNKFTTDNSVDTNITKTTRIRSNSTPYTLDSLAQFAPISACTTGTESACFIYKAAVAGTSAPSTPKACTDLGCEFADGGVTWQAIRGPYFYSRKLRTVPGGETAFIPHARAHYAAPENAACDPKIGTSVNIGINDLLLR